VKIAVPDNWISEQSNDDALDMLYLILKRREIDHEDVANVIKRAFTPDGIRMIVCDLEHNLPPEENK
jgi:hypothetical protein